MGSDFTDRVYAHSPEESFEIVLAFLKKLLPDTDEEIIRKLLKRGSVQ